MWTSSNQFSFFGMAGHWIDNDYVYQERLIDFKFVEGEHDGLNLCNEMMSVLENLGIVEKLFGITADNASNCS
jgi:hypothetical protein